jgi:hypothetical protein
LRATVAQKSDESAAKSTQIVNLTERLFAATTGGDSFVYLEPRYLNGKGPVSHPAQLTYCVRQWGEHPTFDVVIRVREQMPHGLAEIRAPYFMGVLVRGRGLDGTFPWQGESTTWPLIFDEPVAPGVPPRTFEIEISARNGRVVQAIKATPVDRRWRTDSRSIIKDGIGQLPLPSDFREAQDQ